MTSNTPTIQTYPSLELWQAWDEVLFWALILFHAELVPGDLALTKERIQPFGTTSKLKQHTVNPSFPASSGPRGPRELILGHGSADTTVSFPSEGLWMPTALWTLFGSMVVSLSSPTHSTGHCWALLLYCREPLQDVVMFCLSRGIK